MFLGIVGSRRRNTEADKSLIREKIKFYMAAGPVTLVSGGCKRGADRFAEELAKELGLEIIIFYPDTRDGVTRFEYAQACFKRNGYIAEKSDILIACVAPDRKGGTEDTIRKFRANKVFKGGRTELILL